MKQHPPEAQQQAPWWLEGGAETCPHCGQPYHLEEERRCGGCDAPSCAHCLAGEEQRCPDCSAEPRR